MLTLHNTKERYGLLAILFHWTMALLMIGLLILGLYMVNLPLNLERLRLFGWHKEWGLLVLFLAMLRLLWRLVNVTPDLSDRIPYWQVLAARSMHLAFYGFMFILPITGWLIASAAGLPASFFGLFTLPDLIAPDENLRHLFSDMHEWLAYGLIAAICAHSGAALWHHFIHKDDILRRMSP